MRIFFQKEKKDTGQLNCTGRNEKFFVLQQKDADMHLEMFPNLKPDLQLQDKLIRITQLLANSTQIKQRDCFATELFKRYPRC